MTLTEFVSDYGYAAVLVGTLLEGESILLLAGFAAHQGYMAIELVLMIAFVGGTIGDQLFFWAGRNWGEPLMRRFPSVHARALRVRNLLCRWDAALVFGIRFMYGLRIAGPIAMGALHFSPRRFAIWNALGAAVWAVLVGGAGYLLGHSVEALLGEFEGYESRILWGGAVLVALLVLVHRAVARRRALKAPATPAGSGAPAP